MANWITASEERFSDGLSEIDDKRSGMSRRSNKSLASLKSRSSNSSRLSRTSSLARAEERAKVAELLAEKAMLQKKVQLEAAEKEFELDLKIAKAQAREKAFTEIENEKRKIIDDDISDYLHLPDTKSTSKDRKPPTDLRDKTENPTHLTPPLDSTPKLNRALAGEMKPEFKVENSVAQKNDEEILKEVFEIQHAQIQSMISSQQQLATAVSLPQPEVPRFTGSPIKYKTFIMAFDARIQSRVTSNADRLYYLDQHLSGEPKELISSCLHSEPDEGYTEARKLLDKEYGDPYKVSNAFLQKLSNWPIIKFDDGPGLKRFSLFLLKCKNAMKSNSHLTVLNHPPNMQSIVQKLPGNLQTKWREFVVNRRRKDGKVANFGDLTEFVEHAAESANDPIYSRDALYGARSASKSKTVPEEVKKSPPSKFKVHSFAINVPKPPHPHGAGSSSQNVKPRRCPLCDKLHDLDDCEAYKAKSVGERRSFLAGFSLTREKNLPPKEQSTNDQTVKVNNTCVDIPHKRDMDGVLLQSILPVIVTQKGISTPVKTYTFYDNGSAGCFITERLKARLEAVSTDVKLQLGTMHGQTFVDSAIVKNLVVTDLTNSLLGDLTLFRQEPLAFMADIEAMFYQVQVPIEQRDFLRFLWWPGGDLNAELKKYQMTVHPFGTVSSPSCANYALRKTADDNERKNGNAVASTLRHNF